MKPDLSRAQWRKSSYSGNSGNCVEIANIEGIVAVRDSTNSGTPVLIFSPQKWHEFLSREKLHHNAICTGHGKISLTLGIGEIWSNIKDGWS